jgi:hypothetical protein
VQERRTSSVWSRLICVYLVYALRGESSDRDGQGFPDSDLLRSSSPWCHIGGPWHAPPRRRVHDPVAAPMERFTYRLRIDPRAAGLKAARSDPLLARGGWLVPFLILRTQTLHSIQPENFHSGTGIRVQHRLGRS